MQESRVQSLGREDSCGRRPRNPLQEFFPWKFHGQSNLAGHSPHGHKESGTAEHTHTIYHTVSENSNLSSVETEYHQDQLNLLQGIENFIYLVDVLVKSSPFYYVSNISIRSSGQKCLVFLASVWFFWLFFFLVNSTGQDCILKSKILRKAEYWGEDTLLPELKLIYMFPR